MPLQYSVVIGLALLSHGILDRLARATYHPPTPLLDDWFWISSHLTIWALTLYIVVKFWRDYKLSLVCSVLPDFDWVMRPIVKLFSAGYGDNAPLHTALFKSIDFLIPPRVWNALPNWNLARKGFLVEVVLFAILSAFIYVLGKRDTGVKEPNSCQGD